MSYKKVHKSVQVRFVGSHICKTILETKGYLHVAKLEGMQNWYFVDESVKIVGHEQSSYATAIAYCPFCGEKLE